MVHRLEEYKKSNFKLDAAENFLKQKQEAKVNKQQSLEKIAITPEDIEKFAIFSAEKEKYLSLIKDMGDVPEKYEV